MGSVRVYSTKNRVSITSYTPHSLVGEFAVVVIVIPEVVAVCAQHEQHAY
jgi:hypothetical protein